MAGSGNGGRLVARGSRRERQIFGRLLGARLRRRRFESELNRFPQFLTEIDGLDIHFIHVRSNNPTAMPLILTHGWPGSIVKFLKLIGPLTVLDEPARPAKRPRRC